MKTYFINWVRLQCIISANPLFSRRPFQQVSISFSQCILKVIVLNSKFWILSTNKVTDNLQLKHTIDLKALRLVDIFNKLGPTLLQFLTAISCFSKISFQQLSSHNHLSVGIQNNCAFFHYPPMAKWPPTCNSNIQHTLKTFNIP